jgi:hypothetical protein
MQKNLLSPSTNCIYLQSGLKNEEKSIGNIYNCPIPQSSFFNVEKPALSQYKLYLSAVRIEE